MKCSQAELARRLRCSRKTVSKHLSRDDAPAPDRKGLYDLEDVRAYIDGWRQLDNDTPASKTLLEAKIEKLSLECADLRRKLKMDGPTVAICEIECLMWQAINCVHVELMGALNGSAFALASTGDVGQVHAVLRETLAAAELAWCGWMRAHGFRKSGIKKVDWPLPHPSLICRS